MEIDFYKLKTVIKFVELIVIVDCTVSNDILVCWKEKNISLSFIMKKNYNKKR